MSEVDRPLSRFDGISIREAWVDSKLPAGITLCFRLSPTPIPVQWRTLFAEISNDKHGSVMANSNPLLHGDDVVWQVIEGDIPNAKRFVAERVEQANVLFDRLLADEAQEHALRHLEATSQAEIERLQRILDQG